MADNLEDSIREALPEGSQEDFDRLVKLLDDMDGFLQDPPAFLQLDGMALRAFLFYMEKITEQVHKQAQEAGLPTSGTKLITAAALCIGYSLGQSRCPAQP